MHSDRAADTQVARKARGAFFTPSALAGFVARWAVRSPHDRVLEPSCGEASFLIEAGRCLQVLAGTQAVLPHQLIGVDLHEPSVEAAAAHLHDAGIAALLKTSDFFEIPAGPRFDVVAGNPPYVRYQGFAGEARMKAQEAALAQGVRLSGLANSWAAFVVHAAGCLKPDGRLGLVLPAELISVNYAAPVRTYLLSRFSKVRLVVFDCRVFPGVLEEVVLLLAEGSGPTDRILLHRVRDAADLSGGVSHLPVHVFAPRRADLKWTEALLHEDACEVLSRGTKHESFIELFAWGDPNLGIVTGSNEYFTLSQNQVSDLGLGEHELLPISPPGSRHLRSLTFSTAAWERMRDDGARSYLFYPDLGRPSRAAQRYIESGERDGVHTAYKCRVRTPWWRVSLVPVADLLLTYMNHDAPRLVSNHARVRHLNSVHGVVLRGGLRKRGMGFLPIAMLNSMTLLAGETLGRSYGGGILKIEPREANLLPVPSPDLIEEMEGDLSRMRKPVSEQLRNGQLTEAVALVDSVILSRGLGLSPQNILALRRGRELLFGRRVARAVRGVS